MDTAKRQVWLLGGARVVNSGEPVALPVGKTLSLFVYLLLQSSVPPTREQIIEHLWPEAAPERGRRYLSDALYKLRQALGPDWFTTPGDRIAIVDTDLWLDTRMFEQLCSSHDPAAWAEAAVLYSGDLLPEIYEDWILPRRVTLQEKYLACLLRLGETATHKNQPEKAYHYYLCLVEANPLYEEAYRGLMRSLSSLGRPAEALTVYENLAQLLQHEIGFPPSLETERLANQIRSNLAWQSAAQSKPVPLPFVGRIAERAQLLTRLDQARNGKGGLIVILGEAGMGKSRLLDELAEAASWRGWQVGRGSAQEFALPPIYAPLQQAIVALLPKARLHQLSQLVSPYWLALAARLVPVIADVLELPEPTAEPDQDRLTLVLKKLFDGWQQIAPHLLLLDDVQWGDPALWPLLDQLREQLADLSILLIVSGRLDELRAQELPLTLLEEWDRAGELIIHLGGLSMEELQELATAVSRQATVSPDQLAHLQRASGGNPLLLLSLLEAENLDSLPEHSSLTELMQRRLAAISSPALLALQAAAVLGYQFDYRHWASIVTAFPPAELPAVAGELERAGLIILADEGYRFAHDTLRASVYQEIPLPAKERLHRNALALLSQEEPDNSLLLLHHADQGGELSATAHYALQAGQHALHSFNYRAAVDYLTKALATFPVDDWAGRYSALRQRLQALEVLADREAQQEDLPLLQKVANRLNDDSLRIEVAYFKGRFLWMTGVYQEARTVCEAGLTLAAKVGDSNREANLLNILGRIVRDQGDYAQAHTWFTQARDHYRRLGDLSGEASAITMLGIVAQRQGNAQAAINYHSKAVEIFRQVGDLFEEVRTVSNLAIAWWMLSDYQQARLMLERALTISRELEDRRMEATSLINLGSIAGILGDYTTAVDFTTQGLVIMRATNNSQGIASTLGNLAETYQLLGDSEKALAYYEEALALNQAMGRRRGEGFAYHGLGITLLDTGRYREAKVAMLRARDIRAELGERDLLIATDADLALVHLALAEMDAAMTCMRRTLDVVGARDSADIQREVNYAAYCVWQAWDQPETAVAHLYQAAAAMEAIAETLPPEAQTSFFQHVPINRKIRAALVSLSDTVQVQLAQANAPLGRKLGAEDKVLVNWTVHTPADEAIDAAAERRRHVLQRLLAEAEAQGAAPTDEDLAAVLNVSRRTIIRDMKALAKKGVDLPTRRRATQT